VTSEGHSNKGICFSRDKELLHDGDKVLEAKSGGILVNYLTGALFEV
jgi:hypothetical protein